MNIHVNVTVNMLRAVTSSRRGRPQAYRAAAGGPGGPGGIVAFGWEFFLLCLPSAVHCAQTVRCMTLFLDLSPAHGT
jgi:hypothetical protein